MMLMQIGFNGTMGVDRVCSVDQSSKLSFLFREYADGSSAGAIDSSHKGPCAVYMKRVASAINDTAVGPGECLPYFKVGYLDAASPEIAGHLLFIMLLSETNFLHRLV